MKKLNLILTLIILWSVAVPSFAYVPLDPFYGSQQDYLRQINIESAWDVARGRGVVVAVMDSGVDIDHPDLKVNIWKNVDEIDGDGIDNDHNGYIDDVSGWDFVENVPDPNPKFDGDFNKFGIHHGTVISGMIAAAANSRGIVGVAFYSKIMPIRILDGEGVGDVSKLIQAIEYAVNNGADIINLSLVGFEYSENLKGAIEWARDNGVLVIASAGNTDADGVTINLNNTPTYPACYKNSDTNLVLAVSAVDDNDIKSTFASYGTCVDVMAPGNNLMGLAYHDENNNDYNNLYSHNWNGTSFSTAIVSGVAALIKSQNSSLSPQGIIDILLGNTINIDEINPNYVVQMGSGRIDAGKALQAALELDNEGYVAKLPDATAVYYIQSGKRYLFANEATYWSWYSGSWGTQDVKIISQDDFDNLKVGKNITVRPGTNLVKFENSGRTYAVTSESILCRIENEDVASKLYGATWLDRVAVIQNSFETNYNKEKECLLTVDSIYPDSSLIQYQGSNDFWYIKGGKKRMVTGRGFTVNDFKEEFVISRVSPDLYYPDGSTIDGLESNIFIYPVK